jgi:predicted nucleic acid-binding protein
MPAYFDSSVLLSLILGDEHAARACELWQSETERVSSVLLEVECVTVLRRLEFISAPDRRSAEQLLDLALEEVTLKPLDADIASIVRATPVLSGCRTLDAAHVATALFFRSAADFDLRLCSFDDRMADVAALAGLAVTTRVP